MRPRSPPITGQDPRRARLDFSRLWTVLDTDAGRPARRLGIQACS